jgi:hypothetical protein
LDSFVFDHRLSLRATVAKYDGLLGLNVAIDDVDFVFLRRFGGGRSNTFPGSHFSDHGHMCHFSRSGLLRLQRLCSHELTVPDGVDHKGRHRHEHGLFPFKGGPGCRYICARRRFLNSFWFTVGGWPAFHTRRSRLNHFLHIRGDHSLLNKHWVRHELCVHYRRPAEPDVRAADSFNLFLLLDTSGWD